MLGIRFALLVNIIFTGFSLVNAVDSEHDSTEWEAESDAESDEESECKFCKSWVGQILCIFAFDNFIDMSTTRYTILSFS